MNRKFKRTFVWNRNILQHYKCLCWIKVFSSFLMRSLKTLFFLYKVISQNDKVPIRPLMQKRKRATVFTRTNSQHTLAECLTAQLTAASLITHTFCRITDSSNWSSTSCTAVGFPSLSRSLAAEETQIIIAINRLDARSEAKTYFLFD